jgi:hypothetical protein
LVVGREEGERDRGKVVYGGEGEVVSVGECLSGGVGVAVTESWRRKEEGVEEGTKGLFEIVLIFSF